jgi:hypothetical protein
VGLRVWVRSGVPCSYGDIERGIYLIRSENVVLLGEIDTTRPDTLNEVSAEEILQLQHERNDLRQQQERLRNKLLMDRGVCVSVCLCVSVRVRVCVCVCVCVYSFS